MKIITKIILSAALLATSPLLAFAAAHSETPAAVTDTTTTQASNKVNGEVRKVDKSTQKITIKHDELKHLDMPAMTMVFQVKDAAVLDTIKKGDLVEFVAEKVDGQFVATEISPKR